MTELCSCLVHQCGAHVNTAAAVSLWHDAFIYRLPRFTLLWAQSLACSFLLAASSLIEGVGLHKRKYNSHASGACISGVIGRNTMRRLSFSVQCMPTCQVSPIRGGCVMQAACASTTWTWHAPHSSTPRNRLLLCRTHCACTAPAATPHPPAPPPMPPLRTPASPSAANLPLPAATSSHRPPRRQCCQPHKIPAAGTSAPRRAPTP